LNPENVMMTEFKRTQRDYPLSFKIAVVEHSPEEDKSAGSGFERCAATARRVAGRTPAINCQASDK
ncbi:hypothetical protein ACQ8N0_002524, partial [Salmonella enterica subsp. enterica serovar Montevideo]|nr:hypothetical protein [Salmonella enterica subsp. enterica serovar Oranienburg]